MHLDFREIFNATLTPLGETYEARGGRALAYVIHHSKKDGLFYVHYITGDAALKLGARTHMWRAVELAQHFENTGTIRLETIIKRRLN